MLHDHDPLELRCHLRVPTNVPARLETDGQRSSATIRDIGLGGACLIGGAFGGEGKQGELFFQVGDRATSLPTRTVWTAPDTNDALSVGGVCFLEVDLDAGEVLDDLLGSVIHHHRIQRPS